MGRIDELGEARTRGILSRLPEKLLLEVIEGAHVVDYPTGSVALRWDDPPRAGIVLAGAMRAFVSSPQGDQVTITYLRPGDLVGTFDAVPSIIAKGVQALEPAQLLLLDVQRLTALASREPQLAWTLVEELSRTLRQVYEALCVRAFGNIRLRVAHAILEHAEVLGGLREGTRISVTQNELASTVGSVREVVAAAMGQLRRDRIVNTFRGGVVILDPGRLAAEADAGFGGWETTR